MLRRKKIVFPKDLPIEEREAHRRIAFAGANNFRDMGGYATEAGATVKWGVLFRSDTLHQLTKSDQEAFGRLGLSSIVDLRGEAERENEPDRLPELAGLRLIALPISDINSRLTSEMRERLIKRKLDGIDPDSLQIDAYIQFVTRFTPEYQTFFQQVLAANGKPILFHCTGGKDRTGFAAAVMLRLLGVPMEAVFSDYLLTQKYWIKASGKIYFIVWLTRGQKALRLVKLLTSAKTEYLEAAFSAIDTTYGSFDAYVRQGLGLKPADIAALQAALLEAKKNT